MKNLIYLVLAILLITGTTPAEAQFLKKLKKKVEKKVEDAATENISNKAAEETDKSLNKMWENQLGNSSFPMGMDMVDPSEIPEGYDFDWEYTLKMNTTEGEMDMVYHIKENAPYVGVKIPQAENMFTVLDNKNNLTVMYMNSDGNKMVMATRNNVSEEDMDLENPYGDMEFKEIGTKTILGYECQGYRSENADNIFEFYVTEEAGVSFRDLYQKNQKNVPKGLNADWIKDGTGLMMAMEMKDKNNPEKNVSMTCTGIEKKPFSVKTSNYQGMNMGGR
ncbi:DUF4412 domain-containing protein [Salinimicrobium sediminilitoris]|uniref:DUF4412 domain-containing protein n=1 Tax=Salinimicrobium sediminilitoris TaxID=2876715 RepID=UPI001E2C6557|nr:DUF4412 domain-containing protein [Salinimicrobium sediminilitoris]MCC8359685.1 DUF4412 domain-containing protein [Salinimicrobium sediminilitoris]